MSDANTIQASCDTCRHDGASGPGPISLTCYECAVADGNPNWEPMKDGDLTQEELEALADLDIFPVRCGTCGVRVHSVDGPCNRCYHIVSKPLWVPMDDPDEKAKVIAYWRAMMMEDESPSE